MSSSLSDQKILILGRLTYSPEKHKQKFSKAQRLKLASRPPDKTPTHSPTTPSITFGSLNVNGLDLEAHWAVTELLKSHNLDVRIKSEKNKEHGTLVMLGLPYKNQMALNKDLITGVNI